jgi:hypothetical protein
MHIIQLLVRKNFLPKQKLITLSSVRNFFLIVDYKLLDWAMDEGIIVVGKAFKLTSNYQKVTVEPIIESTVYSMVRSPKVYQNLLQTFGLKPDIFTDPSKLNLLLFSNLFNNLILFSRANFSNREKLFELMSRLTGELSYFNDYLFRYQAGKPTRMMSKYREEVLNYRKLYFSEEISPLLNQDEVYYSFTSFYNNINDSISLLFKDAFQSGLREDKNAPDTFFDPLSVSMFKEGAVI